jgi:radical SAM protein with 4Fe4S-binding SPASM domain
MLHRIIKGTNFIKAAYSYLISSIAGSIKTGYMPLSIGAELTNNCNLQCPECSSGSNLMSRSRGFMDIDLYNKLIAELNPYLYNINLYFQGEPMMHPLFFSFVKSSRRINTIVSTNGHFLSVGNAEKIVKSGLSKLIISLDGVDQNIYSAYRMKGSVNTVLDGLKNVTAAKEKFSSLLKIEIQFIVNKLNEDQIPLVRKLASKFKASLRLKSMQINEMEDIASWNPIRERFSRYKLKNGGYVIKNSFPDKCARLWLNPVITWDGKVLPCCFDKNAEHVMGDLNQDTFREIWNGPKYQIFRKSILSGRYMIEMCRNCTSGLRGVNC